MIDERNICICAEAIALAWDACGFCEIGKINGSSKIYNYRAIKNGKPDKLAVGEVFLDQLLMKVI
jgi:hypothetical protein